MVHEQKEVKPYMLNHQKHSNNSFKSAGIKTNNIALNKQLESLKNSLKINKRNKEIEDFVDFSDPVKSVEQKIKEENADTALSSLKKVNIKKKRSKKSLQELTTDVNEPASKRSKPKETNLADQKEIAVKNNKKLNISAANGWVTKPSKKSKNGSKKPEDAFTILESSNNIDDSSYDPIEEKVKKKDKKKKCSKNASKKPKRNKSKPDSKSPPPSQLCGQKSSQNSNSNSNKNSQSYISLTDHNPNHNKPSNQNPNHKSDKSKHLPLTNPQDNTIKIREAVQQAMTFVVSLYNGQEIENLLLEEIEYSSELNQWLVTIGFSVPTSKSEFLLVKDTMLRKYKIVNIDATSGEALSMKIREI